MTAGIAAIREALRSLLAVRNKRYRVDNTYCIVNGDVALIRAHWQLEGTTTDGSAVTWRGDSTEVVRRQPDGTWCYVIDAPFGAS